MKSEIQVSEVLGQIQAIITNSHIIYTSGKHGSTYVNKDAIYPHTEITSQLCLALAEKFVYDSVDVVVAPAIGGVILSQWIAFHLTQLTKREVLGVYAEKSAEGDSFVIKRGYDLLCRSKKVLVVEDILTTGGTVRKVVELIKSIPADVIGVAALCNRGGLTASTLGGIPKLESLIQIQLDSWDPSGCPLCQKGVPINTNVGKGKAIKN